MPKPGVDPRIAQLGVTVNQQVISRTLKHATYLEHLTNNEVKEVVTFLNKDVVPDLLAQTQARLKKAAAKGFDSGPWTTQRLKEITVANNELLRAGMAKTGEKLAGSLKNIALHEAEWVKGALSSSLPIDIDLNLPNSGLLKAIVTSRPMEGKVLKDWFTDLGKSTAANVTRQIQVGIAAGESVDKIMQRLRGDTVTFTKAFGGDSPVATLNRNARAVVRTAVNHTTTQAKEATYRANKDVIKGVRMVATLDSRTSEICMGQDGRVYPIDVGPRPPFHFQCRTTTSPVTKSWKEMGVKLKEKKGKADARASMNGEVPGHETYGTWLKKQSPEFQDRVLGKAKAKLFREGKIGVEDFTQLTKQGGFKTLTLDELKQLEITDEFAINVSLMTEAEKASEIKSLIQQLKAATDDSAKKGIRGKLRAIDKNWKANYDSTTGEPFTPLPSEAPVVKNAMPAPGTGKVTPETKPVPAPKPLPVEKKPQVKTQLDLEVVDANLMTKVGPQTGSNPGGLFKDVDGTNWYVKKPADADRARNEVLAAKLYQAAGVDVPDVRLASWEEGTAVASKIEDGLAKTTAEALRKAGAQDDFAVDAWLANWDVVGLGYDNMLVKNGKVFRVDTGGALRYRAKGSPKGTAFGNTVGEIKTLRSGVNPQAKEVFGNITDEQIVKSISKVAAVTDEQIDALVFKYGPVDSDERVKLGNTLKARREDLKQQSKELEARIANKAAEAAKPAFKFVDAVNAPGGQAGAGIVNLTLEKAIEINALLDKLEAVTNPAGASKIRAALRKLGHKGGLKAGKITLEGLPSASGLKGTQPAYIPSGVPTHVKTYAERYADWKDNLTVAEKAAIQKFTGNSSGSMRRYMYAGVGDSNTIREVTNLEKALAKAPKKQTLQYRGVRLKDKHIAEWRPGHVISQNTVDSFSTAQSTSKSFAQWDSATMWASSDVKSARVSVLYEVQNKFGVGVKAISLHSSENELMSTRGTRLLIKEMQWDDTYKRVRVICEELENDEPIVPGKGFKITKTDAKLGPDGKRLTPEPVAKDIPYKKTTADMTPKELTSHILGQMDKYSTYIEGPMTQHPVLKDVSFAPPHTVTPAVKKIMGAMLNMANQTPDIFKDLGAVKFTSQLGADVVATSAKLKNGKWALHINEAAANPNTWLKLQKTIEAAYDAKKIAGSDLSHVVAHEMGHVFKGTYANMPVVKEMTKFIEMHPPTTKDLSEYALTSPEETFAEAYAKIYTTTQGNWSLWLTDFADMLKNALEDSQMSVPQLLKEAFDG